MFGSWRLPGMLQDEPRVAVAALALDGPNKTNAGIFMKKPRLMLERSKAVANRQQLSRVWVWSGWHIFSVRSQAKCAGQSVIWASAERGPNPGDCDVVRHQPERSGANGGWNELKRRASCWKDPSSALRNLKRRQTLVPSTRRILKVATARICHRRESYRGAA